MVRATLEFQRNSILFPRVCVNKKYDNHHECQTQRQGDLSALREYGWFGCPDQYQRSKGNDSNSIAYPPGPPVEQVVDRLDNPAQQQTRHPACGIYEAAYRASQKQKFDDIARLDKRGRILRKAAYQQSPYNGL